MEVYHEQVGDVLTIAPTGRLDSNTSGELEARMAEIVVETATPMVLDLSGVDYISSAGLRIILLLAKRSGAANGSLALHGMSPGIRKIFDVSGFSGILAIHENRAAALAAVTGN